MEFLKTKRGKITTICIAALALTAIIVAVVFMGGTERWQSAPYDYQSNIPMTDEEDPWMSIDGRLTEAVWSDRNWLEYSSNGVSFAVTTYFTEKGIYVAGKAEDPYIYYNNLYDFSKGTAFCFTIIREDEKAVDVNNDGLIRPCRKAVVNINTKDYVSLSNVRAKVATYVQGTINTPEESVYHETEGWSFETFITWDALRLEDKYFEEDGIPKAVKLYTYYRSIDGENENKINHTLRPLNTQSHRYDSFWTFNRDGLLKDTSSSLLGDAVGGPASSDQLFYSVGETGELEVTSAVNRTQVTWARAPKSENFVIEATFKTNSSFSGSGTYGMGFILYNMSETGQYNIFSVNADELQKGKSLGFMSAKFVDSLQYLSSFSIRETVSTSYVSPYGQGAVHLKLVKVGGYMYYFVDNAFYKMEFIDKLSGEVSAGLFFNYPGSATDFRYEDYTGNSEALMKELSEQAYFISVPGVTSYGSVTADNLAVPKGDAITLTANPNSGYVLKGIEVNGKSILEDMQNGVYTFVPTEDVNVTASFYKLKTKTEANKISLALVDQEGNSVNAVSFALAERDGKVFYSGKDNGRGKIIINVPRKCTISAGENTVSYSGEYTLSIQKDGYMSEEYQLKLGDTDSFEKELILRKFLYGTVSLNDKTTSDVKNTFAYDEDKKLYYHPATPNSGYARAYNEKYLASEYALTAKITSNAATGTINVPGISITTGKGKTIDLKVSGTANRLYIYCGTTEISVTGFNHTHTTKGGTAVFSVVRKGDNLYIFDSDGRLGVILNKAGIHAIGDHQIASKTNLASTNASVVKFFTQPGLVHAVGILNHYNIGSAATYYDIQWSNDAAKINSWLRKVSYVKLNPGSDSNVQNIRLGGAYDETNGFAIGGAGYLYAKSAVPNKAVKSIVLHYEGGGKKTVQASAYTGATGTSTFTFNLTKAVSNVTYQMGDVYKVDGKLIGFDAEASAAKVTFIDCSSGIQYQAEVNRDGSYNTQLFPGTYDVLAVQDSFTAVAQKVSIKESQSLELTMEKGNYYLGTAVVNGKKASSSTVVDVKVNVDAADGKVTIPTTNSTMSAVMSNQTYTGADSFTYTIKVSGTMPVNQGTSGANTQIGFGLTDGTNWWVFYIKQSRGEGKNIGIGLTTHGKGGNDYFYTTTKSPNTITVSENSMKVNAVLTIEKTGDELVLYAGSGSSKVKLLTATAEGYRYADASAGVSNKSAEQGHLSKMASFFDPEKEIALCLASFMHNAEVTYQISVEQ